MAFGVSQTPISNCTIKGDKLLKPIYYQIRLSLLNEPLLHSDKMVLEVLYEPGKEDGSKSYV